MLFKSYSKFQERKFVVLDTWHERAGPGFNFDGHTTGRAWKVVRVNGPGRAGPGLINDGPGRAVVLRPVQGSNAYL